MSDPGLRRGVSNWSVDRKPRAGRRGTRVRVEAEQRRGFAHRVERAGSFAAEPVIAGHRERVQRAEAFLALAHRRCRCGVGADPEALDRMAAQVASPEHTITILREIIKET